MADTAVAGPLARIEPPQLASEVIANQRFIRQLDELRKLKEFLFEEKIQFKEEDLDIIDLEELNNLSYSPTGRVPRLIPLSQGDQYVVSWLPASVDRDGGDG